MELELVTQVQLNTGSVGPMRTHLLEIDPDLGEQIYFTITKWLDKYDKVGLFLTQVVAQRTETGAVHAGTFTYLKRKFMSDFSVALDEKSRKLYILFGYGQDSNVETFVVSVFDLTYAPPDQLGYRRIDAKESRKFRVNVGKLPDFPYFFHSSPNPRFRLPICFLKEFVMWPKSDCFSLFHTCVEISRKAHFLLAAPFRVPQVGQSATTAVYSKEEVKHVPEECIETCGAYNFIFTRLRHLVVLAYDPRDCKRLQFVSYTRDMNLVKAHGYVDAFLLIGEIIEKERFGNHFKDPPIESFSEGEKYKLLGEVHKYVLLGWETTEGSIFVLAVKWPKNWYCKERLPKVQFSRVIQFKLAAPLRKWFNAQLQGTTLYFHHEVYPEANMSELYRVKFGSKFKDYRTCANCGITENRKKKNKNGKRVSKFKVCRKCKELNFHIFHLDPKLACHYCSEQCERLHWKQHKAIHERQAMNRTMSRACAVYETVAYTK